MAGLEELGYPVADILARAGISQAILDDPEGEVLSRSMMQIWDKTMAIRGDNCLGIHVAEAAPVPSFEVHAYAMLSSSTLREAYRRACRLQRLIHETTQLVFEEGLDNGLLSHALPSGQSVARQPAEFLATLWVRFGHLLTSSRWFPTNVYFAHDKPDDISEHMRVFGKRVHFQSGRTAIQIPASILDIPNRRADPGLLQLLDQYTQKLLERVPSRTTISGRVRAWLVEAHGSGTPTEAKAAKALYMSLRTLQRDLQKEGTSFSKVLDLFRQEKAMALLSQRDYSISEVAFLLGFSELSSFYRAFRRWTGKTPVEYRNGGVGSVNLA